MEEKRNYKLMKREELQEIVSSSTSIAEILRKLGYRAEGYNHLQLKKYLTTNNFDTSTLVGRSIYRGKKHVHEKSLYQSLQKNGSADSNKIKQRLILYGVKENKCECCGITEWNGKPIKMELHHINGIHTDNRLENLILLCPNCHSQTHNFRGKNSNINEEKENLEKLKQIAKENADLHLPKLIQQHFEIAEGKKRQVDFIRNKEQKKKERKIKGYCKYCGKPLYRVEQKYCSQECVTKDKYQHIPTKEDLLLLSKKVHSLAELTRNIAPNLTDNAVKKWCDKYGIYKEIKQNFIQRTYPILQYDLNNNLIKEWKDAHEVKKELGFNSTKIQCVARGDKKSYNGYIWKYKNSQIEN